MLFKSPVFSQASGSVAGVVYSRNAGGMYVRSRAKPINPNTDAQQVVRDAMRTLVNNWQNVLSAPNREAWNTYAFNTPTLNKLGEATHKTGQNMYIRGNIPRLQAGLSQAVTAPVVFNVGEFAPLTTFTADASADTISLPFADDDEWAAEEGSAMLVYMGRPQNATRTFGKGPYQLLTAIMGDQPTPPTSPAVVASLFPLDIGQRVFLKIRVTRADGRLSGEQTISNIVVA